ncbi:MAG: sigma-70 family RNA polymerase sigma factor [Firmicutes bacterium]|jgi:RNA polymerase sigma-70 factor (ECF subfamily)|nr:sigma-70 family RNA polymerase sigma factor [Bacillota bacterium]MBQ2218097.1 sigma-70 family RNA polymerase sigma factor [Bacillota bacterium]MBQ2227594.1 sigma-70 family RNA polymerase sigma factor [Bacillota bacterium]
MDFELKRTIERAKKGDEDAFASLISRVQNTGYSVAFRYMENDADTRDVMQEAFIKMYRNLGSFKGDSSFETWFTRILINCCLDELRKRKNNYGHEDIDEHYDLADTGPGTEAQILKKERQKAVTDAIRQLPEEARNIIILREFQGLSYEELADVLDLEPGTVKSRLNRAKQKLKEILLQSMEQSSIWDV